MSSESNQKRVKEYQEKLSGCQGVILTGYQGLSVNVINQLRRQLHHNAIELHIVKNTLFRIALQATEFEGLLQCLEGPVAAAFIVADPMDASKILTQFSEIHQNLLLKGGFIEGQLFDMQGLKTLATLPPKEELLAQLATVLQLPVYQLMGSLQGIISMLIHVLTAIIEKNKLGGDEIK